MDGVRLGLIVRCEQHLSRGLAAQTAVLHRYLRPDRTLCVVMDAAESPYMQDPSIYPDAQVIHRSDLTDATFAAFARDLDVALSCETLYLDSAPHAIRSVGCQSVIQGNYELLYWGSKPYLPHPDLFLAPSPWNITRWPRPVAYLPTPVDRSIFPFVARSDATTFLHVAGHRALADRAGTKLVAQAVPFFPPDAHLIVRSQTPIVDGYFAAAACKVTVECGTVPTCDLYAGADVLLHPRRYGGQSILAQEAASLGLPIVGLDREPERGYLPSCTLVPSRPWQEVQMAVGPVEVLQCDPHTLAEVVTGLHADRSLVAVASKASDMWAETLTWPMLEASWTQVLTDVASRRIPSHP